MARAMKLRRLTTGQYESLDGRWSFEARDHSRTWHVYERGHDFPATDDRFTTLDDAVAWAAKQGPSENPTPPGESPADSPG